MSAASNDHPRERLSEYLDDALEIEERAAIDRHLAGCEDCRAELAALRRLVTAIAAEGVPALPADLRERIGSRLDAATVLRPRRWRFALPATIAATLSAIGILVAIQWREGRLTPTRLPEPEQRRELQDEKKLAAAPPPVSTPIESVPPKEKQDLSRLRAKDANAPAPREPAPPSAPGGVAAGAERSTDALKSETTQRQAAMDADRRDQELAKRTNEASGMVSSAPAAKAQAVSACADRWSDSGARGTWAVRDPVAAARDLDTIAHDVGGMGLWRGIEDGRPYLLIVPRPRFVEVSGALRARGVAGLVDAPALAAGDDCAALSITIVVAR